MSCPQDGGSGVELLFLDLGGFADFVSEIVELGASDMPSALHFDSVDSGGVKRENLFHADTERDTSDSESLADSAAPSCDDNAGEELDTLVIAFDDLVVNFYGVTDVEVRNILLALHFFDFVNHVHIFNPPILIRSSKRDRGASSMFQGKPRSASTFRSTRDSLREARPAPSNRENRRALYTADIPGIPIRSKRIHQHPIHHIPAHPASVSPAHRT